jgi:hypothetical protein
MGYSAKHKFIEIGTFQNEREVIRKGIVKAYTDITNESENWIKHIGYALEPLPDRMCEDTHKWEPEPYEYKYWHLKRTSDSMERIVTDINKIMDLIKIEHEKIIENNLIQKKLPNKKRAC